MARGAGVAREGRKNWEKRGKFGKKRRKSGKVLSLCPSDTDRAGYATVME